MENETPEFETPAAPNKDMWLFLIVLDAVILCVVGFFLDNHFSSRIFRPVVKPTETVLVETVEVVPAEVSDSPAALADTRYKEGMEAFSQGDWASAQAALLKARQADPDNQDVNLALQKVEEMLAQPVAAPQEKQMAVEPVQEVAPQPVVEESAIAAEPPVEPAPAVASKQSIIVTPVNGSKYRRVTFRWFEPAEKVSIVSGFTNRKPQPLKKVGDYWETTLSIAPGTYKFLYVIDGKNRPDPYTEQKDGRSVLVVK